MKENNSLHFFKYIPNSGYKLLLLPVLLIFFIGTSFAQLTTNSSVNSTTMVKNLVGNGIIVSGIKYTGDSTARGLFNGINSNIGLNGGIILSTGAIDSATGPDHTPSNGSCIPYNSGTIYNIAGDVNLDAIEGCSQCTVDASVLEFDFVPQSNTLSFTYVFASEEYPCFVCSQFNDIFAFLISGPDPQHLSPAVPYKNKDIAYIPGTQTFVAINSVNSGNPGYEPITGTFYSTKDCTSLLYSNYYVNNGNGSTPALNPTVSYHGFTTPLSASITVVPCKTYHIKLAIADVNDGKYDSAVLLKENSFASPSASGNITYSYNSTAIEGCSHANVCYNLPQPLLSDYVIHLKYSAPPVNGAVNGIDYTLQPDSVVIQRGQLQACLDIFPYILPGNTVKKAIITAQISTCSTESDTITILPNTALKASFSPSSLSICQGITNAPISVIASGGITTKPYNYLWSNGVTDSSSIHVSPSVNTTYFVTVTDDCGAKAIQSIEVKVLSPPVLSINDTTVCSGTTATLAVKGVVNSYGYQWSTGDNTSSIKVNPKNNSIYTVTVQYALGCYVNTSVSVMTTPPPIANFIAKNDSGCSPWTVTFADSSLFTIASSTYLWNFGDGQTSTSTNPVHIYTAPGKYTVSYTVSNTSGGCSSTKDSTDLVSVFPNPVANFVVLPNNTISELDPTVFISSNSTGNIVYYKWNIINNDTSSFSYTFKEAGIYKIHLYIVNDKGCTDTTSGDITVKNQFALYVPNAFKPSRCIEPVNCVFKVLGTNVSVFQIWIYDRWGAVVYTSKEIKEGWDGKIGGNLADEGTYIYRIDYKADKGTLHTIWGHLTLLR